MDISKPGAPQFVDPKDREKYRKVLARLRDSGQVKIIMEVKVHVPGMTTKKQVNLSRAICTLIANESGSERKEIEEELLRDFDVSVEDMNNQQFNDYLNRGIQIAREFFGVELELTSEGHFSIKID